MNKVIAVKANDDYSLDLRFNDGAVRRFDVKPFLDRGVFRELKNLDYFKRVRIAFGTVQWPNEQDIGPDTLYLDSSAIDQDTSSLPAEALSSR
jgi:hypothetical protein